MLISLMLLSQTKDEVTDAAVDKLHAALGGALSLEGRGSVSSRRAGHCRRHQQSRLLASQDTVRLHTFLLSSAELVTNRKT